MTNTEDLPDDYFSSVAEVVEAARRLDEAKRQVTESHEETSKRYAEMWEAEAGLHQALKKLQGISVEGGRA